jgi:uncharacterized protein YjbI with pentapeptide repeats
MTDVFRSSLCSVPKALLIALAFSLGSGTHHVALAQANYEDEKTPEGWAWSKIKKGEWADFGQRCNDQKPWLDVRVRDPRWLDDCRKLKASFVQDLLTREPWQRSTPHTGVRIKGARIVTDPANPETGLDLENADLIRSVEFTDDQIEVPVNLRHARTDFFISFNSCLMKGAFDAEGLRSSSDVSFVVSVFEREANFIGAKINGMADVTGSLFIGKVSARSISIGGDLDAPYAKFTQSTDLSTANISGKVNLTHGQFESMLNAYALHTGGPMDMRFSRLSDVALGFAKIPGPLDMSDTYLKGKLDAYRLQVEGYVAVKNAALEGDVNMAFAKIGNNLDLEHAFLQALDLSGASIEGELQLRGHYLGKIRNSSQGDEEQVVLNLRNAHIGNLADTDKSWPEDGKIQLSGITIDHLGGTNGDTQEDVLKRGVDWWDDKWAKLNIKYTPSPYSQLAAAFSAMGDRDDANEIRYRAREHERAVARADGKWGTYVLLSVLNYLAGYGIGLHGFVVVWWVLGLSTAGAVVLWCSVPEAGKEYKNKQGFAAKVEGWTWCFGASLSRLLPIIELKEFKGFFEEPNNACFKLWQRIAFSVLGLAGWILGGVLILAISGLTQNS